MMQIQGLTIRQITFLSAGIALLIAMGVFIVGRIYQYNKFHKEFRLNDMEMALKILAMMGYGVALTFDGIRLLRWIELMIFGAVMLVIASIDKEEKKIPNSILYFLAGVRTVGIVAYYIQDDLEGWQIATSAVAGLLVMFVLFTLVRSIFGKRIGMGDVKLMMLVGYYTGLIVGVKILTLALLAALYFYFAEAINPDKEVRKQRMREAISFGPCVAIATILVYVIGAVAPYIRY